MILSHPEPTVDLDSRWTLTDPGRPAFPDEPGLSAEDDAWYRQQVALKYGEPPAPPVRDARGLLVSIADHLTDLGLEPEVQGDSIGFLFLGRLHRVELEDIEARLARCQVSEDELAMMAAGLAVG